MRRRFTLLLATTTLSLAFAEQAISATSDPTSVCPAANLGVSSETNADAADLCRSRERLQDQNSHPEFQLEYPEEIADYWPDHAADLVEGYRSPIHHIPGAEVADPYRLDWNWQEKGRGWRKPIEFVNRSGARLRGNLWFPPGPEPALGGSAARRPLVVVTNGGDSYEEGYRWAAQGLAEAGYIVLTFDPQGHGSSDRCGTSGASEDCPDSSALSYVEDVRQVRDLEDALDWTLASEYRGYVDASSIGLAGHSLGAYASMVVGHRDARVDAIVMWDSFGEPPAGLSLRTPTMIQGSELRDVCPLVTPQSCRDTVELPNGARLPGNTGPDDHIAVQLAERLQAAGVPMAEIILSGSTHFEWFYGYAVVNTPASRLGERVAMHYTLAWFDRWLLGPQSSAEAERATSRLTAMAFDDSSDGSSIGTGHWDPAQGNVPYRISGRQVAWQLSRFYRSQYAFGASSCEDMRNGC